jgi:hypothetical protein
MKVFAITVFEGSGFAVTVHILKGTQTFKIHVILLLISGIAHITSETAGLTILLSAAQSPSGVC